MSKIFSRKFANLPVQIYLWLHFINKTKKILTGKGKYNTMHLAFNLIKFNLIKLPMDGNLIRLILLIYLFAIGDETFDNQVRKPSKIGQDRNHLYLVPRKIWPLRFAKNYFLEERFDMCPHPIFEIFFSFPSFQRSEVSSRLTIRKAGWIVYFTWIFCLF